MVTMTTTTTTTVIAEQQLHVVLIRTTVVQIAAILLLTQALVCCCYYRSSRAKDDVTAWSDRRDSLPVHRSSPVVQNLTVELGERAVFKCTVENIGTRTVSWRRQGDGHPLTIGHFLFAADTRMSVDINQRTNDWSLIIQDVRLQDEGVYQCHLTVKDRQEFTTDIRLIVRTVQIKGTAYVDTGSTIALVCTAIRKTGSPWMGLHWFQDGRRIETNVSEGVTLTERDEVKGEVTSELTIKAASSAMAGEYVCKASDEDMASVVVYVLDDFLMKRRTLNKGISAERITGNHDTNAAAAANIRCQFPTLMLLFSLLLTAAAIATIALLDLTDDLSVVLTTTSSSSFERDSVVKPLTSQ